MTLRLIIEAPKPAMGRRGRPPSPERKCEPLLRFLNTPQHWAREWNLVLDAEDTRETERRRARYAKVLLQRPKPAGVRDLAATIREFNDQLAREDQAAGDDFNTYAPKEDYLWDLAEEERLQARQSARTARRVRAWYISDAASDLAKRAGKSRVTLPPGSPERFRAALGEVQGLFRLARRLGVRFRRCDFCRHVGRHPRVFIPHPTEKNRKDCDLCRRIPAITRSRWRRRPILQGPHRVSQHSGRSSPGQRARRAQRRTG